VDQITAWAVEQQLHIACYTAVAYGILPVSELYSLKHCESPCMS